MAATAGDGFRVSPPRCGLQAGGPARYLAVDSSPVTLGLITRHSDNFCAACDRFRLTVEGRIYMGLWQEDHVDFRAALRRCDDIDALVDVALARTPRAHDFCIERGPNLRSRVT